MSDIYEEWCLLLRLNLSPSTQSKPALKGTRFGARQPHLQLQYHTNSRGWRSVLKCGGSRQNKTVAPNLPENKKYLLTSLLIQLLLKLEVADKSVEPWHWSLLVNSCAGNGTEIRASAQPSNSSAAPAEFVRRLPCAGPRSERPTKANTNSKYEYILNCRRLKLYCDRLIHLLTIDINAHQINKHWLNHTKSILCAILPPLHQLRLSLMCAIKEASLMMKFTTIKKLTNLFINIPWGTDRFKRLSQTAFKNVSM